MVIVAEWGIVCTQLGETNSSKGEVAWRANRELERETKEERVRQTWTERSKGKPKS